MKKFIKLISAFLIVLTLVAMCMPSVSAVGEKTESASEKAEFVTEYPYIFLHGMIGWGADDPVYDLMPYWGSALNPKSDADLIKTLNEEGVEAYSPDLGPFSSAWDSACELYAQLTGTVVDYGEAHSKAHNHDRYGEDYSKNPLMGKKWNGKEKINLVGYSFGGTVARLFTSLLANGSKEELAATGENSSGLFKGGLKPVHSCSVVSAPNNGTPLADIMEKLRFPFWLVSVVLGIFGSTLDNFGIYELKLSHFGIGAKRGEFTLFDLFSVYNFYKSKDNCGTDMTVEGAEKLNEMIEVVDETYYYSYGTIVPKNENGEADDSVNIILKLTGKLLELCENKSFGGHKMKGDWLIHDGAISINSALFPFDDSEKAIALEAAEKTSEKLLPGRWYYAKPFEGLDHFDLCCGGEDFPVSYNSFYGDIIKRANSR